MDFETLFVRSFALHPGSAARRLLIEAMPRPWKLPTRCVQSTITDRAFEVDLGLVRRCLLARSCAGVRHEVESFHYRELGRIPRWRRLLRWRVSGQRILDIAGGVFER